MTPEEMTKMIQDVCAKAGLDGVLLLGLRKGRQENFIVCHGLNGPEEAGVIEQHRCFLQMRYLRNFGVPVPPQPPVNAN